MPARHIIALFLDARAAWTDIRARQYSATRAIFGHTVLFAILPALAGFWGTTRTGWQIGQGDIVRLTETSAMSIAIMYYCAMIATTVCVGWVTHWMARTYGAAQPFSQCLTLATVAATPLFLVGLVQIYPILWLNLLAGLPALGLSLYFFYSGVPVMMQVGAERGFLFATAVVAFGLVALVALLAITALLWGAGFAPEFSR